ncbi:rnf217 [Symbiodinium microadriaticum]|nr:rnf217 [Symbiodinium microadriaticum]
MGDEPVAPNDGVASLVGSEAAFAVINEAWFHVLAGDGDAADLAAAPGCGTPALLDLLTGVELSTGVLGAYTPTLLQGHADLLNDACGGCSSILLRKEEWDRLMWGVRELWGPSQVLRKAVVAVGRDNRSLLAQLAWSEPLEPTRRAALVMLLQAAAHLDHGREGPLAMLKRLLPDGESLVARPEMQQLMSMVPATSSSRSHWRRRPPPPDMFSGDVCPPCVDSVEHIREIPPQDMLIVPKALPAEAFLGGSLVTQQDEAAVLAGLPPPPTRKIGSNISQGLLVQLRPPEDPAACEATQCCICMEQFSACQLWHCGRDVCGGKAFCSNCLRQHAEAVIDSGLYAAPAVRCPVCNLRLATTAWAPLVKEETFAKYQENARALLTYRCAACDETGSYLRPGMEGHASAGKPFGMLGTEARERLWIAWEAFFLAEVPAEKFLQTILDEFSCGHRKGGAPPSSMNKVLGPSGQANWIEDLERRLALQLAWLHRFPRQRTPCCGEQFCFRCKVSSWHRGVTCNDRLRSEKARQAQLCPGCGVPTQRSEGCRKITCVCGRVWEWEGIDGDSSDEEGIFSEDSGAEDEMQAQTAVNLVAMNNKVSDETVRTLIQALVNAGADVNGWPSERCPLLLAVQCRNTAAVAALCEVGARVTPEVLEELKGVSLEWQRCEMERLMRPQVQGDPNMRLPLWVWIQAGSAAAVEALLRNAAHEEAVGEDVFIALQRSSGDDDSRKQIAEHLREHVGETRLLKSADSPLLKLLKPDYAMNRIPLDATEPEPRDVAEVCWQQKAADVRAMTGATRDEKVPDLDALLETDGMQRRPISRDVAALDRSHAAQPQEATPKKERRVCLVSLRASGAGIHACNRDYRYCGLHQGKPMFKADNGAVIYFNKFWKMNSIYKTTGWVYSVKEHAGPWPAETQWIADGTAEPNAGTPPSLLLIDEPLPPQVAEESAALVLEDGQKVLKREENKRWRWNEVYIRSKEDILKSLASGMNHSTPGYNQQPPQARAPNAMPPPSAATAPPPAPPAPPTARETQSPVEAPKSTTLRPGFLTGASRAKEVTQKAQRQPSQAIVLDYPDGAMVEFDRFSNGCSALLEKSMGPGEDLDVEPQVPATKIRWPNGQAPARTLKHTSLSGAMPQAGESAKANPKTQSEDPVFHVGAVVDYDDCSNDGWIEATVLHRNRNGTYDINVLGNAVQNVPPGRLRWPKLLKPDVARAATAKKPLAGGRPLRPSDSTRESLAAAVAARKKAMSELGGRRPPKETLPKETPPRETEMVVGGTAFTVRRLEEGEEAPPKSLQSMLAFLDAEANEAGEAWQADYKPDLRQQKHIPLTRGKGYDDSLSISEVSVPKARMVPDSFEVKQEKAQKVAECPPGPPAEWSMEQVLQFLDFLGLGHTGDKFKENAVDGPMLAELSEEELCSELGLLKLQEQFQKMHTFSATRRMLMEVRQALDEERDIEVSIIQEALQNGADPNAREKEEAAEDEALGLTGLALLAMCYRSSTESVTKGIEALLEARADLETEVDDGATPLLVALRHRNMTALEVLAKASAEGPASPAPRIATEILDEVSCLSEDSRRLRVEELLRPVLRGCGRGLAPLPLWTWVEHGSVAAVEALLRSSDEAVSVEDVISLQRCRVHESMPQIQELLQRKCGEEEFSRLQTEAATRRLLQELREAFDDQRDVDLIIVQNSLELHADPNAQEEEAEDGPDFQEGSYSLSALQLLVTNLHVASDTMQKAVAALVEAKAQVNADIGNDTPLLSALQSRCVNGVAALCQHGAKVSSDCLDELKTISSSKVRHALEDVLQPLIGKDKRLRCPLWMWVQIGAVSAAEAIVRNASHDEEIDVDVLVALQRCRDHSAKEEITSLLQDHLGEEEFKRLEAAAATRRLLMELREAHTEEREPELDIVCEALAQGANPNAQEEDEEETDEEEGEDEEDEAGSMEEDEDGDEEDSDKEDGETEPEGEWDEVCLEGLSFASIIGFHHVELKILAEAQNPDRGAFLSVLKLCPCDLSRVQVSAASGHLEPAFLGADAEAMTAEDVSKLFDCLRDTVVFDEIESFRAEVHAKNREIAKTPSEVKLPQSLQFNSLQLIMDFKSSRRRCVLKACPLPASLGPIMSNRRYLHEAMTAEDVSKLFDSLCDTVVSALAKRDAEIEYSAASSFDPLQLVLDFQSLQQEVRELKEDARESHATREAPVAQSEAPPKFKQLEKQPQPNCSSRSRAALQAVYGMVAQCAATEAQRPCPHRGGNSSVAEQRHSPCRTTKWKRTRSGGTDIRQGPHHARRDNTGFIREGECFTVVEERGAETDGLFLRLEGEKGWVFSAGRSGIFCQRMRTEAAEGDGWAKDAWTWRGSTEAQGLSGHGRERSRNGVGGIGTVIRAAPEEKENYCAKSGRHRSWHGTPAGDADEKDASLSASSCDLLMAQGQARMFMGFYAELRARMICQREVLANLQKRSQERIVAWSGDTAPPVLAEQHLSRRSADAADVRGRSRFSLLQPDGSSRVAFIAVIS